MTNPAILALSTDRSLERIRRELERDPKLQSAHSRRGYLSDLAQFEEWRKGRPMTKLLVQEFATHLQHLEKSPNSVNRALAAVRWWARRISDLAFEHPLPKEQRDEIVVQAARVASIEDVSGERQPKGRHLELTELSALLQACSADSTPAGVRDAAMIVLAWTTGLRRSEITSIRLEHWNRQTSSQTIIIKGKGNKSRQAFLHEHTQGWLRRWLKVRGDGNGPLFCPIRKGGKVQPRHGLSDEALAQILAKRQAQAGLTQPITWHDFRRTFAGNLLDSNVDLVTVQKLLGHSSPTTTSQYDRRDNQSQQRAVRGLQIPRWSEVAS